MEYSPHCRSLSNKIKKKHQYLEFNLGDYDSNDVEKLVVFYKTTIDVNEILNDGFIVFTSTTVYIKITEIDVK